MTKCQDNEKKSGKNHMKSIYLNNIICLSDMGIRRKIEKLLNEDQLAWFNNVLKKELFSQMAVVRFGEFA